MNHTGAGDINVYTGGECRTSMMGQSLVQVRGRVFVYLTLGMFDGVDTSSLIGGFSYC